MRRLGGVHGRMHESESGARPTISAGTGAWWATALAGGVRGGLTVSRYAERLEVNATTLYAWRQRKGPTPESCGFGTAPHVTLSEFVGRLGSLEEEQQPGIERRLASMRQSSRAAHASMRARDRLPHTGGRNARATGRVSAPSVPTQNPFT